MERVSKVLVRRQSIVLVILAIGALSSLPARAGVDQLTDANFVALGEAAASGSSASVPLSLRFALLLGDGRNEAVALEAPQGLLVVVDDLRLNPGAIGTISALELPAAPSSFSLVLSAMLTLGAFQAVRNAGNIHLSPLPEWYHTGGPTQVGHATPFNLCYDSVVVCAFAVPAEPDLPVAWVQRDAPQRVIQTFFSLIVDIRGPPMLCNAIMA